MGRKLGRELRPLSGERGAESPSNTKSPGLRPTSIASGIGMHPAVWAQYKFGENWGGECSAPFFGEGAGSPSNTKSPGPFSLELLAVLKPCLRLLVVV